MSQYCVAVLSHFHEVGSIELCKQHLTREATYSEIGMKFELGYDEPFFDKMIIHGDKVICNFSDAQDTINCEKLLCPDGCNSDIWPNIGTLDSRINKIINLLRVVQRYAYCIDLYIGESGDLDEDFLYQNYSIVGLKEYLVEVINSGALSSVSIHLSII